MKNSVNYRFNTSSLATPQKVGSFSIHGNFSSNINRVIYFGNELPLLSEKKDDIIIMNETLKSFLDNINKILENSNRIEDNLSRMFILMIEYNKLKEINDRIKIENLELNLVHQKLRSQLSENELKEYPNKKEVTSTSQVNNITS